MEDYPTTAPWWPLAELLTLSGADVLVVDPSADGVELYWDEDDSHGKLTVVGMDAAGWTVTVYEQEFRPPAVEDQIVFDPAPGES